jgi:hypothetical protein
MNLIHTLYIAYLVLDWENILPNCRVFAAKKAGLTASPVRAAGLHGSVTIISDTHKFSGVNQ